jgi:hypothetical protein
MVWKGAQYFKWQIYTSKTYKLSFPIVTFYFINYITHWYKATNKQNHRTLDQAIYIIK